MEIVGGKANKGNVCVYEFFGTALYLLAYNWGGFTSHAPVAIAVFVGTMMCARISGAHFNPAVTLGVLITNGGEGEQAGGRDYSMAIRIVLS